MGILFHKLNPKQRVGNIPQFKEAFVGKSLTRCGAFQNVGFVCGIKEDRPGNHVEKIT
jgi:hypothetical protein